MRRFPFFLLVLGAVACAQEQPTRVYPRIETGVHSAMVVAIDTDSSEQLLFSASEDKTARVWDLRTGKLLQVLRPPIGDGDEGKLYAVAASPSGKTIALGGFTGESGTRDFSIYIFDRATGAIADRLSGIPDVMQYLTFSRDGRYLAAGLAGKNGIRIYNANGFSEVARDTDYGADVYWAEFDGRGRLVTAAWDGYVRLYSSDFRLLRKVAAPGGKQPYSARFSPDNKLLAVGFEDSMAVDILAADDLSFQYTLQVPSGDAGSHSLATAVWSADGKTVCAAGRYTEHDVVPIVCWSGAGKNPRWTFPVAGSTIMDLHSLRNGDLIFSAADGSVGRLTSNGAVIWRATPSLVDFRVPGDWPRVSNDGTVVESSAKAFTGTARVSHRLAFSLSQEKLSVDADSQAGLRAPAQDGVNVANWNSAYHPTLNGHELPLSPFEQSRSLAVAQGKASFVLGTAWYIRKFNLKGTELWSASVPAVAFGVNITGDGRFVVAILGDGTIRWYQFDSGKEVLALLVDRDMQRWVAWNPDGFFTFKNGGDSLMGYQINRGPGQAADFVKVDQLRDTFYRADLVTRILYPGGSEAALVARNRVGDVSQALNTGLPPEIESVTYTPIPNDPDSYLVQFHLKDMGGGTGRVVYRVDGAELAGREGRGEVEVKGAAADTGSRLISVGPGTHQVTITAASANGKVSSKPVTIQLTGRQATGRPSLYVVAAGISHYSDHSMDRGVAFAAQDAESVAAKFKEQEGKGLYSRVTAVALPDSRATVKSIQAAVSEFAAKVKPEDTFVLYLSGHGTAEDGKYYFLPWEAEYTNLEDQLKKSLSGDAIRDLLAKVPTSKSALILDTCGSGQMLEGRGDEEKKTIERVAIISGHAVLAASTSSQMALDGYQGHGVFTYFLLQGMDSVDSDRQGTVLITGLAEYVQTKVPEFTTQKYSYRQIPLSSMHGEPFPIAQHKPVN